MYAIVEIGGKQFKVTQDQYIYTDKVDQEIGDAVSFDKVLLLKDEKALHVGSPSIAGVTIQGKVIAHLKGEKVIVFKKKRRRGYKLKKGHRQDYTKVLIEHILK